MAPTRHFGSTLKYGTGAWVTEQTEPIVERINARVLCQFVKKALDGKDIAFESITEKIDTTSATGSLIFHIFASLAEFERALIKERTNAGLSAARTRGCVGGRPKKLNRKQIEAAIILIDAQTLSMKDIAEQYGVSRGTLYRNVLQPSKA